jgi:hypothetical protein
VEWLEELEFERIPSSIFIVSFLGYCAAISALRLLANCKVQVSYELDAMLTKRCDI